MFIVLLWGVVDIHQIKRLITVCPLSSLQVYSFCSALIDNVLAYGCRSKSEDVVSLRNIGTQTPALLNAAKVMVEQCEIRHSSLEDSKDMSIKRTKELKQMDDAVKDGPIPVARRKNKPPEPPKPEVHACTVLCVVRHL